MKKRTKKILISYAVLLLTAFTAGGIKNSIQVDAQATSPFENIGMIDGAGVRYSGENKATNGLRFGISLPKATYDKMATDYTAYTDVTYGVLIAPEDMLTTGKELTEDNVFGSSAIYDWAEWTDENGWVYNGTNGKDGGKKRIIHLTSTQLTVDEYDSSLVSYYGAIIDIQDEVNGVNNLAREFRGVGYVSYKYDGEQDYIFVGDEDNVRSMAYIAQRAIAENHTNSSWLQEYYVDKVTDVQSDYTVEYYLQQGETYVKNETASVVKTDKTIDDEVTAETKIFDGYEFDSTNANNVLSGKVLANDKLVLKCYYNEVDANNTVDLGLIDRSSQSSIDLSSYAEYTERTLRYASGGTVNAELSGDTLATSTLNGAYVLRMKGATGIVDVKFDVYASTSSIEWLSNDETFESVSALNVNELLSGVELVSVSNVPEKSGVYYQVSTQGSVGFEFNYLPIHSKAYYERYLNMGMTLNFNYFVAVEQSEIATATAAKTQVGFADDELWTEINVNTWYTASISLDSMINSLGVEVIETSGQFCRAEGAVLSNQNAVTKAIWYIGDFTLTQDISSLEVIRLNESLIDLKKEKSNDFETILLTEDQRKIFDIYKELGEIVWTANGMVVGNASQVDGLVEIVATLKAGDESATILQGKVDFYNSDDGMVWVNNSNLNIENAHAKKEGMTEAIATTNLPQGAIAEQYFYITDDENDGAGNFLMAISAIHSKEYYQMWKEKGVSVLQYDVYLTDAIEVARGYFVVDKTMMENFIWIYAGKWQTIEIPIDILLDYYDDYGNDSASSFNYGNMLQAGESSYHVQMYIGNFRAAVNGAITDETVNLADTKGTFDFVQMLTDNGKTDAVALINDTEALGELVLEVNNQTVTDVSTLEGVYEVTAKRSGVILYTGKVDFYNSDDGMVWVDNSNLNIESAKAKIAGMTEEIVTTNLPDGAIASQYFYITDGTTANNDCVFSIGAIHSKEYYQTWLDKGVSSLVFDIYSVATSNYYCRNLETGNDNVFVWVNANTWTSVTLSLEKVISYFDEMMNDERASSLVNMLRPGELSYNCAFYVGNFRAAVNGAITDETINLADTKGTFDFAQMLTDNGKTDAVTLINDTASLGELTLEVNNQTVVDVSALEGVYTVTAKRAGMVLYTGQVDFYNSDDGMVWVDNSNLNLDNAHTKYATMTKSIATTNLPENAVASQYFYITDGENGDMDLFSFAISAIHSKEYYVMWQKKGVTHLVFDVYETADRSYYRNIETDTPFWVELGPNTISISMEKLLAVFDGLSGTGTGYNVNMLTQGEAKYVDKMYVGNFRGTTVTE